jgi:hypothetical protein
MTFVLEVAVLPFVDAQSSATGTTFNLGSVNEDRIQLRPHIASIYLKSDGFAARTIVANPHIPSRFAMGTALGTWILTKWRKRTYGRQTDEINCSDWSIRRKPIQIHPSPLPNRIPI